MNVEIIKTYDTIFGGKGQEKITGEFVAIDRGMLVVKTTSGIRVFKCEEIIYMSTKHDEP